MYEMRSTIEAIIGVVVLYAAFAFVSLEANPTAWQLDGRGFFVICAALVFAAVKTFPRF